MGHTDTISLIKQLIEYHRTENKYYLYEDEYTIKIIKDIYDEMD